MKYLNSNANTNAITIQRRREKRDYVREGVFGCRHLPDSFHILNHTWADTPYGAFSLRHISTHFAMC